jgi:AcrR family transcriptional regulator
MRKMISLNNTFPVRYKVDSTAKTARRKSRPRKRAARRRLDPAERKKKILEEATRFFAVNGLDAQIKDLAAQIGVSEGLIFRYFETKQKLIDAVYEGIGFTSWFTGWEAHLRDKSVSLSCRLKRYYRSYLQTMEDPNWIGITIFATVTGRSSPPQMRAWGDRMISIVAKELRAEFRPRSRGLLTQLEIEMAWHLHATFTHYFVRKYLYRIPVIADRKALVSVVVDNFLSGLSSSSKSADGKR